MAAGVRDRRVWIVVGVVAAALLAMVWLRSLSSSDGDVGAAPGASPSLSSSLTGSPVPSTSATESPDPGVTASTTGSAPGSPAASPTTSSTGPTPVNPIADDGLPTVTIARPVRGSTVSIPVQLTGTVVAFEAVLRWEILDPGGEIIANGPAYADAGAPERGHWQVEVELPIGSYTAVAFVESAKDGSRIAQTRVKFKTG